MICNENLLQVFKKVQVGKDQEKAQSEKDSHSKNPMFKVYGLSKESKEFYRNAEINVFLPICSLSKCTLTLIIYHIFYVSKLVSNFFIKVTCTIHDNFIYMI